MGKPKKESTSSLYPCRVFIFYLYYYVGSPVTEPDVPVTDTRAAGATREFRRSPSHRCKDLLGSRPEFS